MHSLASYSADSDVSRQRARARANLLPDERAAYILAAYDNTTALHRRENRLEYSRLIAAAVRLFGDDTIVSLALELIAYATQLVINSTVNMQ